MFTLRGHRIAGAVGIALTVLIGWHLLENTVLLGKKDINTIDLMITAAAFGATSVFLAIWLPVWHKLEALTLRAARESMRKVPDFEAALRERQNMLGLMLGNRGFRQGLARTFDHGTFRYHPTIDKTSGVLSLDLLFPKEWDNTAFLTAAIAYIYATRPDNLESLDAQRNETKNGTRIRFAFIPTNKGVLLREQADALIKEWALSLGPVVLYRFKERFTSVSHIAVFDIEEHDDNKSAAEKDNDSANGIPPITNIFQHNVELKKENLQVTVGFNGKSYYTHFDGKQKREYRSWGDFVKVWGHFDEIKHVLENYK